MTSVATERDPAMVQAARSPADLIGCAAKIGKQAAAPIGVIGALVRGAQA
jgi:hypothetical protein